MKPPTVQLQDDGRYSITVADDIRLIIRLERANGQDHWFVDFVVPDNTPIYEHRGGYSIIRPTRN
jgi:hypothetical protein